MSTTFPVSDVEVASARKQPLDREATLLRKLLHQPVEALYEGTGRLVLCSDANALVEAAQLAFIEHRPLTLSPDAVWLCIARGFAEHVNQNSEALRRRLVRHEGQLTLVVERADFTLGQPNPWPEAFAAFSDKIAEHVGKLRDLVVADFSTTGPTERAASDIVLMDGFQAYFEYVSLSQATRADVDVARSRSHDDAVLCWCERRTRCARSPLTRARSKRGGCARGAPPASAR